MTNEEHHPGLDGAFGGAFLAGRVLTGGFYLYSAFVHFASLRTLAGYAASKGVPAATLAVAAAGVLLLVGGITLLLGWHPRIELEMSNFLKNLALLGSALMFLAVPQPWPCSLRAHARHVPQPA